MFVRYIALLPEFLLFCNCILMLVVYRFRQTKTPKTFATLSKIFVALAMLATIVFYNQGLPALYLNNTLYTTFFKTLLYILVLWTDYLACKWFLNKNHPSLGYYSVICLILAFFSVAISAGHLLLLCICLTVVFALPYFLACIRTEGLPERPNFSFHFICFLALLGGGCAGIFAYTADWSFAGIAQYYQNTPAAGACFAAAAVVLAVLYLMGAAPFHVWSAQIVKRCVLPAGSYVSLIPVWGGMAVLLSLGVSVFPGIQPFIGRICFISGILSVLYGVWGAESGYDVRQIFSYAGLYCLGVVLIAVSAFSAAGLQSGIIFLLSGLTALCGAYTSFYGIRSKGMYLHELKSIAGMAEVKPYISAALIIFIVSILGLPPFLGMIGNIAVFENLLDRQMYGIMIFIFVMLVWLAHSFLYIIKSVYFDKRNGSFDRADAGVYLSLLFNILLMGYIIVNPQEFRQNIAIVAESLMGMR